MSVKELRQKSQADLQKELNELLREQMNLNMQKGLNESLRPHQFTRVRRDIARVKTILREKGRGL